MSEPQVPPLLQGAWRRKWIQFADGQVDDTSTVLWLQYGREMVDVRFAADRGELAGRGDLSECSMDDLLRLAASDSSSGHTECTPIEVNAAGLRTATAQWFSDVSYQPVTSFPEAGRLEWSADATVMTERAPSGAYEEEWNLVAGTADTAGTIERITTSGFQRTRFSLGPLTIEVEDRRPPLDPTEPLPNQLSQAPSIGAARALLDCEFTLAERNSSGEAVVTASTHPWRIGDTL